MVQKYGIMLLEKKMLISQDSIEFLGMKIANGTCVPQPHIIVHLQYFPNEDLPIYWHCQLYL